MFSAVYIIRALGRSVQETIHPVKKTLRFPFGYTTQNNINNNGSS